MEVAYSLISDVSEVDYDTYHVTLLAIIIFLTVRVLNVVLTVFYASSEVIEVSHIYRICQHIIKSDALDSFRWHRNFLHSIHYNLISKCELVPFLQVVGLFDKPLSVTQLDSAEEVGQILVHLYHRILLCKVKVFERLSE